MRRLAERLPVQFRVIYHQFLLRVVDLEALSIQADIPRFLGQFAGVLILLSLIHAVGFLLPSGRPGITAAELSSMAWNTEQNMIATMMLVAGLIAVISWDAIFPDRRDVMVLSPLPVRTRMILFAKVAASAAILGLAILTLNFATSVAVSLVLGGFLRFLRVFAAYWFTMAAVTVFIYGSVLTVQGFTTLLLSRRLYLRLSALLQLSCFVLFLAIYFLLPYLDTPAAMSAQENRAMLAWSPSFWFFALFNQLNASLPRALEWLAIRAWIGLGIVVVSAVTSLLLCYMRTMKKMVEEPDLVPGTRGWHWNPRFGNGLRATVVLFSIRSLVRSKHHRVAFAFYLAIVIAIGFSSLKHALAIPAPRLPSADYLTGTVMMMTVVVIGLRSVFSLPITLNANWVLRVTELGPPHKYIAATRWALIAIAVFPVWLYAALLSLCFRPMHLSVAHLLVLALVGFVIADVSLIGVSKIPFACSYLPGKSNIQYMFWGFILLGSTLAMLFGKYEERALHHSVQYFFMIVVLATVDAAFWVFNWHRAKSAKLYFEELPPEVITTLGIGSVRPSSL